MENAAEAKSDEEMFECAVRDLIWKEFSPLVGQDIDQKLLDKIVDFAILARRVVQFSDQVAATLEGCDDATRKDTLAALSGLARDIPDGF